MGDIYYATVRLMKEGRITVPSEIREAENLQEGDILKITIEKIEKKKRSE